MSNQIVTQETPVCLFCGAPKAADGSRFCCADHFIKYQIAVAASLPPLRITVLTRREKAQQVKVGGAK